MKDIRHLSLAVICIMSFAWIIIMATASSVYALLVTEIPKDLQTTVSEPQKRFINLVLPLLQPDFHWVFLNKEDYLAGKLILRIKRGDKITAITIFENGKITEGWKPTANNINTGGIYFGFESSIKYETAPDDTLEIELHVIKDLTGIGSIHTGILSKGIYKSRGTYSALIDNYKVPDSYKGLPKETLDNFKKVYDFKALLGNWTPQWKLKITGDDGWTPPEQRKRIENIMKQLESEKKAAD